MKDSAVVTVLGKDRSGIIAEVSAVLAAGGANIEEISQTILEDIFTMTLIVSLDAEVKSFADLQSDLSDAAERMNVQINLQKIDVFRYMHRI